MLITGASAGIGKDIALTAAKNGYDLLLISNSRSIDMNDFTEILELANVNIFTMQCDISSEKDIGNIIQYANKHLTKIDVLVNNAGFLHQHSFEDISIEEWNYTFNVNLRAPFLLSQKIIPQMRKQGGGHIINIASIGGQLGGPLAPHYAASKAGLICLTKSLARIGANDNIITHVISPGLIATEMITEEMNSEAGKEKMRSIPLGRIGTTGEIANLVLLLCSGQMDYATGQTINFNGGLYMG